ncbi:sprT domain-containing protein [Sphingobacterium sp. UT-1RO-CII-1]|uniref:SprT-like domain-containing protein n=1 Tax=Sphingobacterium sp. UT-1RO-CII-1 TaxID=2995225 RepID=UPI00227ADFAF|nr:SprT-like domain-containing protein [Sphingobacterium sp. UT-1RO-CII-1]MCY4780225.1 sprT domain-containing protein [Sphingobacterium sp. UT-1RO-CII-1]
MLNNYSKQLSKYIPQQAAPIIAAWIIDSGCLFRIARSRKTKLGDYTAPFKGEPHKISVNHDLNPYAFLITTIHEFAHLKTWQQFKNKVKPHGMEWKTHFKILMEPFLKLQIFPEDIHFAITKYMDNPAASSCTDLNLYRVLRNHDKNAQQIETIESIPEEAYFKIKDGRVFQKKEKLRKRYKCIEINTNKTYLFHPIAEVTTIKE